MLYLQGLDSDFLEKTPEAKAMREVEQEIIGKAQEAIRAAEAAIQEEKEEAENKVAETKVTKKRTPRKKKED